MSHRSISCPAVFRGNVCAKLKSILLLDGADLDDDGGKTIKVQNMAQNIEISIYNRSIDLAAKYNIIKKWGNSHFCTLYIERVKSLFWNLREYEEFRRMILNGHMDCREVGYASYQAICPDIWQVYVDEKRKRDIACTNVVVEASTDKFTCSRCKSKRCTYYEMQTRSADESLTVFITCLECDKRWKI